MKPDFTTTVDFASAKSKAALYNRLKACTGKALVTVEAVGPQRTLAQNAFYHGVCVKLLAEYFTQSGQCDSQAEAHDLAHEHLKERFLLRVKLNPKTGEAVRIPGSTRRLSVGAFVEFIERCLAYPQTEWGCTIPNDKSYRE